jgi:hypothetical protein
LIWAVDTDVTKTGSWPYSSFRHSAGLIFAALIAWDPTVIHAIIKAISPDTIKYHHSNGILYENLFNQLFVMK